MTTPRVTREQWGAIRVDPDRPTRVASTDGTAVHWVGPRVWGDAGPAGRHSLCAGKVQGIQRQHMRGEWYDIAYSEIACPHGTRFEGRGHHVQTGANGSAEGNRSHYAILALVGIGDPVTPELLEALDDAFEDYRAHADAGRDTTTHTAILKRYTGKTTACPGPELIRVEAAGRFVRDATPTPPPVAKVIPGTNLPLLKVDGDLGPSTTFALGTIMKARGFHVIPSKVVTAALVVAIQRDLNAAKVTDARGRALVVDGAGFGSNSAHRFPREGFTRTIQACQIGHGVSRGDADGAFDKGDSSEVRRIQADANRYGVKDSPFYNG